MKKATWIVALVLCSIFVFGACGQPAAPESTATASASESAAAEGTASQDAAGEKEDIQFYGKIVEYEAGPAAVEKLAELVADKYNVEGLQVDWGNLDTVIRTGIGGGDPSDVYQYWPQNMRPLVDSGMAYDLTAMIENDPDIKNMISETALNAGKYDGKYYALPMDANFSLILANKDILDANGIEVPTAWTWDEFLAVSKKLKDAGIFPMGQNTDNQQGNWFFRNGILSLAASSNQLDDMAAGKIPATDALFTTVFENVQGLYDNEYMYPGQGAVTVTRDEVKAGFLQGKVAMIGDIAAGVNGTIKEAQEAGVNTVMIPWPSMGTVNAVLGGYDGLFIPANAKNPEASFEVIKAYLGEEPQKLFADSGLAIVNKNVEITDPVVQQLVEMSKDVYPFELMTLDAKINDYLTNEALAEVVLGAGPEAAQQALEALRAAAVG